MNLYARIKNIYPDIPDTAFILQDDGKGPYIKEWSYNNKPKPTQEQIDASSDDCQYLILKQVEERRKSEYSRRSDPMFFQYQRAIGTDEEESLKQSWLDEVAAIKEENPYPTEE